VVSSPLQLISISYCHYYVELTFTLRYKKTRPYTCSHCRSHSLANAAASSTCRSLLSYLRIEYLDERLLSWKTFDHFSHVLDTGGDYGPPATDDDEAGC